MARKRNRLPNINSHPGDGYYYVICDVCGKKMRARDARLQTDKFNTQYKLLVCKDDLDETNPQQYIRAIHERQIRDPSLIRSESEDEFAFIDSASEIEGGDTSDPTGQAPGVPRHLVVIGATSAQVEIQWLGPESSGSGAISGWKIERESPVGGGFSTLKANTQSVAMYYKDTTVSASTQYNYRVSAINRVGTGSPSNEADVTTGA